MNQYCIYREALMDLTTIPERKEIPVEYTWDLTDIFPDDEAWAAERTALLG